MSSMSSVSPASPEYGREYKIYNVADYPDAPSPPMSPREEGPGRLDIDAAHQRWERVASTFSPGECDLDNSKCGENACPCFDLFFRTFDVDPGAYDLKKLATVLPVCDRKNICLHILHFSVMSGLAETSVLPVWEGVYMAEANFQQLFESLKSSVVEDQDVYIRNAIDAALEDLTNASRWKTLHFLECLFLASIHAGEGAYAECKTAGGFIRDSVDCCVCLDPFNTSDRVPLVGRCGHSWCSSCLDLVGTDCPLCREPLGTDKYAVNFSLRKLFFVLKTSKHHLCWNRHCRRPPPLLRRHRLQHQHQHHHPHHRLFPATNQQAKAYSSGGLLSLPQTKKKRAPGSATRFLALYVKWTRPQRLS